MDTHIIMNVKINQRVDGFFWPIILQTVSQFPKKHPHFSQYIYIYIYIYIYMRLTDHYLIYKWEHSFPMQFAIILKFHTIPIVIVQCGKL